MRNTIPKKYTKIRAMYCSVNREDDVDLTYSCYFGLVILFYFFTTLLLANIYFNIQTVLIKT